MTFKTYYLPSAKELLDIAFRRARKEAGKTAGIRNPLKKAKTQEIARIQVVHSELTTRLSKAVKSIPSIKDLNAFDRELFGLIVEEDQLKKGLAQMTNIEKIKYTY